MACFLVPGTEAIVVSAVAHSLKKREEAQGTPAASSAPAPARTLLASKAMKAALLANLLWGGVVLLAFEHLWHGEISPVFPFITASGTDAMASVWQEMATVGVGMALAVTAVWAVAIAVAKRIGKCSPAAAQSA